MRQSSGAFCRNDKGALRETIIIESLRHSRVFVLCYGHLRSATRATTLRSLKWRRERQFSKCLRRQINYAKLRCDIMSHKWHGREKER